MRMVQTILFCLLFNISFSQKGYEEKHTIALNIVVDSSGSAVLTTYVSDSSNVKGLTQTTINKMIEITQKKVKSMRFPASNTGYKQLAKFDFTTVGSGSTKE